jgi:hypothetical protein
MRKARLYQYESFFDSWIWRSLKVTLVLGVILDILLLIALRVFHLSGRQLVNVSADVLTFHWW